MPEGLPARARAPPASSAALRPLRAAENLPQAHTHPPRAGSDMLEFLHATIHRYWLYYPGSVYRHTFAWSSPILGVPQPEE